MLVFIVDCIYTFTHLKMYKDKTFFKLTLGNNNPSLRKVVNRFNTLEY